MNKTEESFCVKQFDEEDIPRIAAARFLGRTRKETKIKIEKIKRFAGKGNMFVVQEKESFLLCGFSPVDIVTNQASIWIYPSDSELNSTIVSNSSRIISFLLYEGFYRRKLHKINFCINESNIALINLLKASKWKQEGILIDHLFEQDHYFNGILFAMIETDFHQYSISMIPFLNGYLIIQTTNTSVLSISIIKEREGVPSYIDEKCGYRDQISENNKIFRSKDNNLIFISENAYPYLIHASNQLFEYTRGVRTQFDLSFEYSGATEFQKQVWNATMQIPYGQTRTYAEIANQLRPNEKNSELSLLSRAVGTALGKNPIMIAIPCHRVIGKDGKLKGFAGGLEVKDYLLSHEMLFLK